MFKKTHIEFGTALIYLSLMLVCSSIQGQDVRKVDSLKAILEQNIHDTARVQVFISLSEQYGNYYSKAIDYATKAQELSKKIKYVRGIKRSNVQIAVVYLRHDKYDKSLEAYLKHIKFLEARGDSINALYMNINIGIIYYRKNDFKNALKYFQLPLGLLQRRKDSSALAATYSNIALVQFHNSNYSESEKYGELALDIYTALGDKNNIAGSSLGLADICLFRSDFNRAHAYYNKAKELYLETNDEYGFASVLMAMADLHLKQKEHEKAIENLQEAESVIRKIDVKVLLKDCYAIYAQVYSAQENYKKAFEYSELLAGVKDSILTTQNMEKLNELQVSFDTEKKEQDLKLKETELKASENTRNGFIVGFGLVLILCCVSFYSYRASRKANKIITLHQEETEKQKNIIEEKQKEMLDSIKYAKRIQQALLPSDKYITKNLKYLKGDKNTA